MVYFFHSSHGIIFSKPFVTHWISHTCGVCAISEQKASEKTIFSFLTATCFSLIQKRKKREKVSSFTSRCEQYFVKVTISPTLQINEWINLFLPNSFFSL